VAKLVTFRCERLADGTHIGRTRNFGEDLNSTYRDGRLVEVNLDEIDRSTETFSIVVRHTNQSRRILAEISEAMAHHFPDRIASLTVEDLR
jgi:hypothetical protein